MKPKMIMNRPGFFHFYTAETSAPQMPIPTRFTTCMGRDLPKRVFLRDRYHNMWCVKVGKVGEDWYFQRGWQRFVKDNALKSCDFIVFDYFEKNLFDFKILDVNQCETVGAGGLLYYGEQEDVFEDELDDEEEEDCEEELDSEDFGGGDYHHPYCNVRYNLPFKQKVRSNGDDDDDRIDDKSFVKQEPKSETDDDEEEEEMYKAELVRNEAKHEEDYVRKELKRERDDLCNVCRLKKLRQHERVDGNWDVDVKNEPKDEEDDGHDMDLDDVKNDDIDCVKEETQHDGCEVDVKSEPESEGEYYDLCDVCLKQEPQDEEDDGCDDDDDDHDSHDNMATRRSPQVSGDVDGNDDYAHDSHDNMITRCSPQVSVDVDTDDVENHDNTIMRRSPQISRDAGTDDDDDDHDDFENHESLIMTHSPQISGDFDTDDDDDAHDDVENHDNMIMTHSPQLSGVVDTNDDDVENDDNVIITRSPQLSGDVDINDDDDAHGDVENDDNVIIKRSPQLSGDVDADDDDGDDAHDNVENRSPQILGDVDADDTHDDVQNHDSMTVNRSSQILGNVDVDDTHDDVENHDNMIITHSSQTSGDVDVDADHVAHDNVENHDNTIMTSPLQIAGDVDAGDDDTHDNAENHDNMIMTRSPQISRDVDAFVEREENADSDADDGEIDDDEEIEDADYLSSEENDGDEYIPKSADKVEKPGGPTRKRASVFPRYYGMHIFDSGVIPKPRNPYFITHVAPRRKGDLFIPTELIKDHNLEMPKPEMMLVDEHGREFRGKYKEWRDGRVLYSKGWRTLWKLNRVSRDDFCLCEFKQGRNGLYLKVTIIYVNGGPPIEMPETDEGNGDDLSDEDS